MKFRVVLVLDVDDLEDVRGMIELMRCRTVEPDIISIDPVGTASITEPEPAGLETDGHCMVRQRRCYKRRTQYNVDSDSDCFCPCRACKNAEETAAPKQEDRNKHGIMELLGNLVFYKSSDDYGRPTVYPGVIVEERGVVSFDAGRQQVGASTYALLLFMSRGTRNVLARRVGKNETLTNGSFILAEDIDG